MTATTRVFAGECTARFTTASARSAAQPTDSPADEPPDESDHDQRVHRGHVVALVKPDDTVLVHDADGYQPVAWLTRADSVSVTQDGETVELTVTDGAERLAVSFADDPTRTEHVVSAAGQPVGDCPDCDETLVRAHGEVTCLGCSSVYALPSGATVLSESCRDCGLPQMRVRRGQLFEVCLDRSCESLSAAVESALDRAFDCPDCGSDLRVQTYRGRQFLGCDRYPECETSFSIPSGELGGECACGLPLFEMDTGLRCLDGTCDHDEPSGEPFDDGGETEA